MRLAWSKLARQELEEIRRFSVERWGAVVAHAYLGDIRDAARAMAERPERGRPLRGRLRIHRERSHYLILNVDAERQCVTVARVLHTAMDVERHLPKSLSLNAAAIGVGWSG